MEEETNWEEEVEGVRLIERGEEGTVWVEEMDGEKFMGETEEERIWEGSGEYIFAEDGEEEAVGEGVKNYLSEVGCGGFLDRSPEEAETVTAW
jgi:hypothetical protein